MSTDTQILDVGDRVSVDGYSGAAWVIDGRPLRWEPEIELLLDDDGEEIEIPSEAWGEWVPDETSDSWRCHMVGDDREFLHDESALSPLSGDDYCSECGQIGCTADGRERDER